MRLGFERRRRPTTAQLVIVGGTAASFLYAALLGQGAIPGLGCHFRTFLGIECPTCGTTRVLLSLLEGDLAAAVGHNPLIVAFALAGAAVTLNVAFRLASGRGVVLSLSDRDKRVLFWGFWALLLANWAFVLAT